MSELSPSSPPAHPRSRAWTRRAVLGLTVAGVAPPPRLPAAEPTGFAGDEGRPLELDPGPHLFLDDHLVDRLEGLERRAEPIQRRERPVLDRKSFGCTQPYVTVIRDRESGRFRLWYNRGSAIWHAESANGLHWENPRVAWDLPRSYGASLIDDGDRARDPARRYKLANWQATRAREDKPGDDGGMYVGFSPDGFHWTASDRNPVLPTWPEGYDTPTRHGVGDIVDVYYDPLSRRCGAAVKVHAVPEDGYAPARGRGRGFADWSGLSTSPDFLHWNRPHRIFAPDAKDEGLLEFYGMGAMHLRGSLRIGLVACSATTCPATPADRKTGSATPCSRPAGTASPGTAAARRSWTATPSVAPGTTP